VAQVLVVADDRKAQVTLTYDEADDVIDGVCNQCPWTVVGATTWRVDTQGAVEIAALQIAAP